MSPRVAGAIATAFLVGCASQKPTPAPAPPPAPQTRVVLLPQRDAEGRLLPTAVEVQRGAEAAVLDRPFALAESTPDGRWIQRIASTNEIVFRFGDLFRIQPPSAERFLLHFLPGKSQLTPESERLLPELIRQAQARAGGEIIVIGHTDRVGKAEANDALSLQRAQAIARLLQSQGFAAELITAIGRGEREPLVPTADEVAEPRNRRAEVIIR